MVPKVRLGGVGGSGIFGGVTAPESGAVGLVVLSQREFGVSYCGGCIGVKKKNKQDRMCIKPDCTVLAHKSNPWTFDTSSISSSGRFVFIGVKDKEDLVWTATTLPFETIQLVWASVSKDRRPLTQWQNFFDQMRGADGSGEHVELALQALADADSDIRATGEISLLKRAHLQMSPSLLTRVHTRGRLLQEHGL